jgi:O-antigen/teichoic acid export membrane protein
MGVAAALQFPFALYGGGLLGLQRQVTYNVALAGMGVVRGLGAVLVLVFVSPTVEAFFWWQVMVSAAQSILGARLLWASLPHGADRARFDWSHIVAVWRFAAGTGGTAALGAVRAHLDKILLSRLLPLEQFGYYSLGGVLGASVYSLATPFYMAYFPRLSEVVAERNGEKLSRMYHEGCQLVSAIVVPAAAVAAVFAEEIIFVWTGNAGIASSSSAVSSLLIVGYALAALNGLPYTLQLASGWTSLAFRVSLATLIAAGPLIVVGTMVYGATGAAAAWLGINGVYTVAMVNGMHRRLLRGEMARWYVVDVGLPVLACSTVAIVGHYAMPPALQRGLLLVYIGGVSVVALSAAIAVAPFPRQALSIARRRIVAAVRYVQ